MFWQLFIICAIICPAFSDTKLPINNNLSNKENLTASNHLKESSIELQTATQAGNESDQISNVNVVSNVLHVMQMSLNDEDKVMLQNLNGIIEKMPEMKVEEKETRLGKSFKDVAYKKAAEALSDEEITEIVKSISFPHSAEEITEDTDVLRPASDTQVEPRSVNKERVGKAIKNRRGYYVIVFTPIEAEPKSSNSQHQSLPYLRLQILPAERSANGDDARFISRKAWNKYIRLIMRQIRRGTRKIQRKTKLKSLQEEPTLESFLQRMYNITQEQRLKQQQKKKKSSWLSWR